MANTYTQIIYHIVFSTKNRQRVITDDKQEPLYRYIWGIHKQHRCNLHRIGGVDDHIHLLTSIHQSLSLAGFVEHIKTGSTNWIRREEVIPAWPGWQSGYGGFTVSWGERQSVVEYIKNQKEHHKSMGFREEYRALLEKFGVEYDE